MLDYSNFSVAKQIFWFSVNHLFSCNDFPQNKQQPLSEPMIWWPCLWMNSCMTRPQHVNSLAPGRSEFDYKNVIFNLVLLIGIFRSSHDKALWWMLQDLTDDKSKLVQVIAWCRQATSHYLSQCWLSCLSPYGIITPQWVNTQSRFIA